MKHKLLLFGFAASLLTACSTYKAGQTPDDVYYSPAREGVAKVETNQNERYNQRYTDRYETNVSREDDQYLRMKIRSRDRWSMIDDYDYWYDSRYVPYYTYNYYRNNWNNFSWYNGYPGYNSFNNYTVFGGRHNYYNYGGGYGYGSYSGGGYFKNQSYVTKRPPTNVSKPVLGSYNNRNYDNSNRGNLGSTILKAISPSSSGNNGYSNSNTNNNTYTAPERSYTPPASSSSSNSSSSGSSSSGGGVSRPARGGN